MRLPVSWSRRVSLHLSAPLSPIRTPIAVRMASTLPKLSIFEAIASHDPKSTAIVHSASNDSFTYGRLLHDVASAKDRLVRAAGGARLEGERVAFLVQNGYGYVGAA